MNSEDKEFLMEMATKLGQAKAGLGLVVEWWDALPPTLRQDIEGSGAEPGCIAFARRHSTSIPE